MFVTGQGGVLRGEETRTVEAAARRGGGAGGRAQAAYDGAGRPQETGGGLQGHGTAAGDAQQAQGRRSQAAQETPGLTIHVC